jgi:MFS family permease
MFIPLLLLSVPGGTFADRVDRRLLVLTVTVGQAMLSAVLFALAAFEGAALWWLYLLVAAQSALGAVSAPARQTFIPRLVPEAQRAAAMALNRIVFQVMMIAGPALAGLAVAGTGVKGCYLIDGELHGRVVGRGTAAGDAGAAARPVRSGR